MLITNLITKDDCCHMLSTKVWSVFHGTSSVGHNAQPHGQGWLLSYGQHKFSISVSWNLICSAQFSALLPEMICCHLLSRKAWICVSWFWSVGCNAHHMDDWCNMPSTKARSVSHETWCVGHNAQPYCLTLLSYAQHKGLISVSWILMCSVQCSTSLPWMIAVVYAQHKGLIVVSWNLICSLQCSTIDDCCHMLSTKAWSVVYWILTCRVQCSTSLSWMIAVIFSAQRIDQCLGLW
jgi:hypothetical protein